MKTKKTKMHKFTEMLSRLSEENAGSRILFSLSHRLAQREIGGTDDDLDEAKELLMALTKQGVSKEPTSLHRAVMLLLMDYIQRASRALADAEKLTPSKEM